MELDAIAGDFRRDIDQSLRYVHKLTRDAHSSSDKLLHVMNGVLQEVVSSNFASGHASLARLFRDLEHAHHALIGECDNLPLLFFARSFAVVLDEAVRQLQQAQNEKKAEQQPQQTTAVRDLADVREFTPRVLSRVESGYRSSELSPSQSVGDESTTSSAADAAGQGELQQGVDSSAVEAPIDYEEEATRGRITIFSIPGGVRLRDVREFLQPIGTVRSLHLPTHQHDDSTMGYALAKFESNEDADAAVTRLNGALLGGQPVVVRRAAFWATYPDQARAYVREHADARVGLTLPYRETAESEQQSEDEHCDADEEEEEAYASDTDADNKDAAEPALQQDDDEKKEKKEEDDVRAIVFKLVTSQKLADLPDYSELVDGMRLAEGADWREDWDGAELDPYASAADVLELAEDEQFHLFERSMNQSKAKYANERAKGEVKPHALPEETREHADESKPWDEPQTREVADVRDHAVEASPSSGSNNGSKMYVPGWDSDEDEALGADAVNSSEVAYEPPVRQHAVAPLPPQQNSGYKWYNWEDQFKEVTHAPVADIREHADAPPPRFGCYKGDQEEKKTHAWGAAGDATVADAPLFTQLAVSQPPSFKGDQEEKKTYAPLADSSSEASTPNMDNHEIFWNE